MDLNFKRESGEGAHKSGTVPRLMRTHRGERRRKVVESQDSGDELKSGKVESGPLSGLSVEELGGVTVPRQ